MSSISNSPTATLCAASIALTLGTAGTAHAAGELNIFNWGDYTSPELIEKFEQAFDVEVTLTDYDSNDTALAKVRAGGHGFDIVVPSANYVPIWVSEGLLLEARPDQMENFEHVAERWVDVDWDPGRRYTVPWLWGLTGIVVDTSVYDGDIDTSAIFLDPPEELVGRINVAPEMSDVMHASIKYMGGDWCTDDKALLRQVRDKLVEARESWIAMDYGTIEKFASRDYAAAFYWNGAAMRSREKNPDVRFGYPKEGFPFFMDSVAILADAGNVENAKAFMNFIMLPEHAAMLSNFAKYANGIDGSEEFMDSALQDAPELVVPDGALRIERVRRAQATLVAVGQRLTARATERARNLERRLQARHPERRLRERMQRVDELDGRLARARDAMTGRRTARLDTLVGRLRARHPKERIDAYTGRLDTLALRLHVAGQSRIEQPRVRLQLLMRALDTVSPLAVLDRGFAVVRRKDRVIRAATELAQGDRIDVRVARGRLEATVERVMPDTSELQADRKAP